MVSRKKVAIIGGGVSGIAAAKAFAERGHDVQGFERGSDIGGVWEASRSYPGIQTQSAKDLYCFTDMPMPGNYPEWPSGAQVREYLNTYVKKHKLQHSFALNTKIAAMDHRSDGKQGWTLEINDDAGSRREDFDFVAICTGQFSDKKRITHSGQREFVASGGTVIHSSEYSESSMIDGKHVVVVGGSKSATDVAVNAAKNGAKSVALVYRKNIWRVPYRLGGINFKRLVFMRFQEAQFNGWNRSGFEKTLAAITKPLVWANFRGLETMLKFQLGLKKWNMVPDAPIETVVSCNFPVVTPGLFESFADGTIKPVKASIAHYENGKAVLSNGDQLDCDITIQATGWELGVPFLGDHHQIKLVEPDGQYRLHRYTVNPDLPDMGFVGFNTSFCTMLSSEISANWLVRYMDEQLADMPTESEMNNTIEQSLKWRREERPIAQSYGGLCIAPFHFRHFDELLADMGCTKAKRANRFAEYMSYPNAKAFGNFLTSAPQYAAQ